MKRKKPARDESVVSPEILDQARRTVVMDQADPSPGRCQVCGDPVAPNSAEKLCWVCRRLKISAWRESDQQMPAQE